MVCEKCGKQSESNVCFRCQYLINLFQREPWPWQLRGVDEVSRRIEENTKNVLCVSGPTGTGKSAQMLALIRSMVQQGKRVAHFVNRNLLYEQTIKALSEWNIRYGCRGAQFVDYQDDAAPVQICSVPTEQKRVYARREQAVLTRGVTIGQAMDLYKLPPADVVLIDEIHMNAGPATSRIVAEYQSMGANVVCYTATPLDISHICQELIIAGTKKEGRAYKALVPAVVYAGAEIDTTTAKRNNDGEFSSKEKKRLWSNSIFGYILQEWKRLNPDARMTLGFGPDVGGSVWLAQHFAEPWKYFDQHKHLVKHLKLGREWEIAASEEFYRHGVSAAHIDGSNVWVNGHEYRDDLSARADVLERWKSGEIKVLWNRWVMREGLDFPDLYHGILACFIGKVSTYDQIVGRFIRYSPSTSDGVIITDHGGNYWRHGSPNADRDWQAYFTMSAKQITDMRLDAMAEDKIPRTIICQKCGACRNGGSQCHQCGHISKITSRMVLQSDGSLRPVLTDGLKPKKTATKSTTQKDWDDMYFAAKRSLDRITKQIKSIEQKILRGDASLRPRLQELTEEMNRRAKRSMTWNQLYAKFYMNYGYYPPRTLKNMPRLDADWYDKVRLTEIERCN